MDNHKYQGIASRDWPQVAIGRLKDPVVVWADRRWSGSADMGERIAQEHSFVLESTPFCQERDADSPAMFGVVERYGGAGIGSNGGGGRCINYEAPDPASPSGEARRMFQAKGTGANLVVGQHDDKEHSYGGLDARKAIVETIYTTVLDGVLPLGTVKIFGLIFTGRESAFNGIENCWGVTMIRDHCLRPAHFLKARDFKPSAEFRRGYPGELARMRRLYRGMRAESGGHQEFIRYIGQYLRNAANQFGFAKAARISHGTLSPSNLGMDGRWLDLPVASFLSGGINYNISSVFYSEGAEPLAYALEILHNYSKFNDAGLNASVLVRYYSESLESYFKFHLAFVFGVPIREAQAEPLLENASLAWLARLLGGIIHRGRKIRMERPVRDESDPVVAFVAGCYASLRGLDVAGEYFRTAGVEPGQEQEIAGHFRLLVNEYVRILGIAPADRKVAIDFGFLLVALKRGQLASAFYLPVVDDQVKHLCANGNPEDIAALIDDYADAGEWIFDGGLEEITLFRTGHLAIRYSDAAGYRLCMDGEQWTFGDYPSLHACVKELDASRLVIRGFDYAFFFDELERLLPAYERAAASAASSNPSGAPQ